MMKKVVFSKNKLSIIKQKPQSTFGFSQRIHYSAITITFVAEY